MIMPILNYTPLYSTLPMPLGTTVGVQHVQGFLIFIEQRFILRLELNHGNQRPPGVGTEGRQLSNCTYVALLNTVQPSTQVSTVSESSDKVKGICPVRD